MTQLLNAIPGALAQGLIWGVMAIGVYITYKVLDIADLTVDGSLCTGAAVCTMLLLAGLVVAFHIGREERVGEVLSNRPNDSDKRKTEEHA